MQDLFNYRYTCYIFHFYFTPVAMQLSTSLMHSGCASVVPVVNSCLSIINYGHSTHFLSAGVSSVCITCDCSRHPEKASIIGCSIPLYNCNKIESLPGVRLPMSSLHACIMHTAHLKSTTK